MSKSFVLTKEQVKNNISVVQSYLNDQNLDGIYISSFDEYINEYVPMSNCHRYFLTGFSGSTAEAFVPKQGKARLYVDGRYHEQADLECDLDTIEVVKASSQKGVFNTFFEDLDSLNLSNVAIEGQRTSVDFYKKFNERFELTVLGESTFEKIYKVKNIDKLAPIKRIDDHLSGASVSEKLSKLIQSEDEAYFVNAIDSLAWLTNCRGYHLPFLSSFLGKGVAVKDKVFVFINEGVEVDCDDPCVEFVTLSEGVLEKALKRIADYYKLTKLYIDESMLNAADYLMINNIIGKERVINNPNGIVDLQAIKNAGEIEAIKASFNKSDKAIYNTLCWVKKMVEANEKVSEKDLYEKTSEMYKEQGAVTQSFNTIAGVDANGSIIHYSDPKDDVLITDKSMVLLDSGGYFEGGFATDTTRTFMGAFSEGSKKQKRIYTYTLKGILNLQNAVFKPETTSLGLDAICRQPLHQAGYDYAHGTGHGVGIHVHEPGTGISSSSKRLYKLKAGHVVSLEPGIYIPGFGGVRIENIGIIIEHPSLSGFLTFEPLVYIGYEPKLIDESLLNTQEKIWLEEYEAGCVKRGTSFLML